MKRLLIIALLVALVPASVALASGYLMQIVVTESGDISYTEIPISVNINNDWMVDNGFIGADARDTRVEDPSRDPLPHMVTENTTWVVMDLPASSVIPLSYTSGNDGEDFDIITGLGGYVTVSDNETIELRGDFIVEVAGFFKTTADWINYNILYKNAAYRLYISAAGKITSDIIGEGSVDATDIPSGYHIILIETSSGNMTISIDGTLEAWVATANVTNNGNDWILGSDATPYISYLKITR